MAEQDWLSPNPAADALYALPAAPGDAAPAAPGYELRPLSVGEILDRIFSLYRNHFWLFAGLSAASASVSTLMQILRLIFFHFSAISAATPSFTLINGLLALVQGAVYLVAYSVTHAATTSAVHAVYLGRPTSFEIALDVARRLWLRCLGIGLWQAWSATWVFLALLTASLAVAAMIRGALGGVAVALGILLFFALLASGVYGVVAYLRNSLAVPAAVVEGLGVRAAIRRSKRLATGRIGRIFLLILLLYALWMVAALIEAPLAILLLRSPTTEHFMLQAIILAVNFFATSVVAPIGAIGLCLFYFDERVRREAFDIQFLLEGAAPPPATVPPPFLVPESVAPPMASPEQI